MSLLASVLLHAAAVAALLIVWHGPEPIPEGASIEATLDALPIEAIATAGAEARTVPAEPQAAPQPEGPSGEPPNLLPQEHEAGPPDDAVAAAPPGDARAAPVPLQEAVHEEASRAEPESEIAAADPGSTPAQQSGDVAPALPERPAPLADAAVATAVEPPAAAPAEVPPALPLPPPASAPTINTPVAAPPPAPRPAPADAPPKRVPPPVRPAIKERNTERQAQRPGGPVAERRQLAARSEPAAGAGLTAVRRDEAGAAVSAGYTAGIAGRLRSQTSFPAGAPSGTVVVHFSVDRSGRLLGRNVVRSSGSPQLDAAALSTVERAAPFPAFPQGMTQTRLEITVPLGYRAR